MTDVVDIYLPKASAGFVMGRRKKLYVAVDDLLEILESHRAIYKAAGLTEIADAMRAEISFLSKIGPVVPHG